MVHRPETFLPHVGTEFRFSAELPCVDDPSLTLVEVTAETVSGPMRQFSLFFHGPASHRLGQGTYEFTHPALGTLALFIVPVVGSNKERIIYQACFG